jgi:hypothetical protein
MKLEVKNKSGGVSILVREQVKSMQDSMDLKEAISKELKASKTQKIEVVIMDSFVITSSIIGSLLKFINADNADLELVVQNAELYEFLQKMNLVSALKVRRGA